MKFDTSKNKLNKIKTYQETIDNFLFHKKNVSKILKPNHTILNTTTILYESGYQTFGTNVAFGGLISIPIDMPIVASSLNFTDSISITKELIPYVKHNIIVKKPTVGEIRGLYVANISTYNNNPDTQVGIFKENTPIRNHEGAIIGNTGTGSGTAPSGSSLVTVTSHALFIIDGQRNIYSDNRMESLIWLKSQDGKYQFDIGEQVMFIVPSDENVGTTNQEGDRVYVATLGGDPLEIFYYTLTDNRISVSYPAYRPIEIDIEAKLILSIPYSYLWGNYSTHEN